MTTVDCGICCAILLSLQSPILNDDRQIAMIHKLARDVVTQEKVRRAVRLGCEAFNFEWDGHVQAMTGQRDVYWSGKSPLTLSHPEVRLPRD